MFFLLLKLFSCPFECDKGDVSLCIFNGFLQGFALTFTYFFSMTCLFRDILVDEHFIWKIT